MLDRYSRPEMRAIWNEESKFGAWLKVELLACEAWSQLGEIPAEDVAKLALDVNKIHVFDAETEAIICH